jgi:erythromycin esterase
MICLSPFSEQKARTETVTSKTENRLQTLKKHAFKIRSRKISKGRFKDLMPLKEIIGDARIVLLGEPTHGHGTTMEMKGRLIRFLHEQMGFNVLAWESNMACCREVDRAFLENDEPIIDLVDKGIFAVFAWPEQNRPLFEYIKSIRKGDNPLIQAGFDFQFSGTTCVECLTESIIEFFNSVESGLLSADRIEEIKNTIPYLRKYYVTAQELQAVLTLSDYLLNLLDSNWDMLMGHYPKREMAFQYRVLLNIKLFAMYRDYYHVQQGTSLDMPFERDRVMADNFIFLRQKYFPDEKIIVWAASGHILRNSHLVNYNGQPILLEGSFMGDYVALEFGEEIYSIATISYEGESQYVHGALYTKIQPAKEGTFSWYFNQLGGNYYFLDMKSVKRGSWIRKILSERPWNPIYYYEASWPEIFDAFVYIKTVKPCVPVKERRQ